METALLIVAAIVASEILLRLPLLEQPRRVSTLARKAGATLRSSRISDHWKEAALPAWSLRMGGRSLLFFLLLCVVALPVVVIGLIAPGGMAHWIGVLERPMSMLILCAASIAYVVLRVRLGRRTRP